MGTNFYERGYRNDDDPEHHIGKRSAAGWYCWDCGVTLCIGGIEAVHSGSGTHKACPKCGKVPDREESLDNSAAGRELGFNKTPPTRKTGVRSCSSFSPAMPLEKIDGPDFGKQCPCCGKPFDDDKRIEDEYGRLYTVAEFREMLTECPIILYSMMGRTFS